MRWRKTFVVALILVLLPSLFPAQSVSAELNRNSFGRTALPDIAYVNWTYFWQFFTQHAVWMLEYNNGSGWRNCKEDLRIIRTYFIETTEGDYEIAKEYATKCKITLDFTARHTASYRLTFAIDLDLWEYIYREDESRFILSYGIYKVYFDFSDLKEISKLTFDHGSKDVEDQKWFWFRVQRENVPEGVHVTLDPAFGYDTEGETPSTLSNYIRGSWFTCPYSKAQVDNITVYLNVQVTGEFKCAIYREGDNALIAETEARNITAVQTDWFTFSFSEPKPVLRHIEYTLVAWAEKLSFVYANTETDKGRSKYIIYTGSFPETLEDPVTFDAVYSIYCNYTELPTDEEVSSGTSPTTGEGGTAPPIVVPEISIPTWGYYVIFGGLALVAVGAIYEQTTSKRRPIRGVKQPTRRYKSRQLKRSKTTGRFTK